MKERKNIWFPLQYRHYPAFLVSTSQANKCWLEGSCFTFLETNIFFVGLRLAIPPREALNRLDYHPLFGKWALWTKTAWQDWGEVPRFQRFFWIFLRMRESRREREFLLLAATFQKASGTRVGGRGGDRQQNKTRTSRVIPFGWAGFTRTKQTWIGATLYKPCRLVLMLALSQFLPGNASHNWHEHKRMRRWNDFHFLCVLARGS